MKGVGKMKKSQDVIGLPVFSIVNGIKIGQVKDLVINPEEGKVDFILVSDGSWYVGAKVLPFKDVMGIGEYALTIESENMLLNIANDNDANNLLKRNIEIKGNRVLTNKGNLIGIISEYEFDENTGSLHKLEYKNSQGENKIENVLAADVLTFGADVVVVKEQTDVSQVEATSNNLPDNNTSPTESEGAALFKEKQRSYLLGKKLSKDIINADGSILFTAGQEINEHILNLAEKNNKLADLSESLE